MTRKRQYAPLNVYQNNRLVGQLLKEPSGAVKFRYDDSWLDRKNAYPVSLSLPLREDAYRGAPVAAVFENLLPDSEVLLRRVAEKVGADGIDAYSLLSKIGHDCVGALQFIADGTDFEDSGKITGEIVEDDAIEKILNNLVQAPLGLERDDDFRISVAGAQEKTALLWYKDKWHKPHGATPTTHIFKTQIGKLPNGIDLTNSVENEFYCLKLIEAFGLPVNSVEIKTFGETKALVIERFDRKWANDGRLLRLPQEDCCQALSVPPTRKYERDGGPGIADIIGLLKGSNMPAEDQETFFKAQILFWLMGATDGHAKNFSIYLMPGGRFQMTPLYDVLTAQPHVDARQIKQNQMTLAMCAGKNRHYRIHQLQIRHFIETGAAAGLPKSLINRSIESIVDTADKAFENLEPVLPSDFPPEIHDSLSKAMFARLKNINLSDTN